MKKSGLFIVILGFLVLLFAGPANSWQGRMAGMGDPYGLVVDESDFLIHPAGIVNGKGVSFYGNYRLNYTNVMDWDYTKDSSTTVHRPYRGSGDEWEHNPLLGGVFPLGPGRMGFFFGYKNKRGDYNGDEIAVFSFSPPPFNHSYSLDSDLDEFSLRLLYGLPMGGFKLGGEIQLAYRKEKNETSFNFDNRDGTYTFFTNDPFGALDSSRNLFPFMFPYDSKYWEALFKGSFEGMMGPVKMVFTMRGGFIFSGDNKLDYTAQSPTILSGNNLDGDVKGWSLGADLWLRYPLSRDLSLPFLFKIGYEKKIRDGSGQGIGVLSNNSYDYENRERDFQLEVGGGADKEFNKGTRIAAGIYYGYLQNKSNFLLFMTAPVTAPVTSEINDHYKYPDHREHQIILRLAGEKEFSPMIAMRVGLNFFYGWVKQDLNYFYSYSSMGTPWPWERNAYMDGSHWGIKLFLGGTVKLERFSIEPFIGGGYQKLRLNGDSYDRSFGITPVYYDETKKEWSIGGGFSIKFN